MPWKYTDEYYQAYTRQTWDESSETYRALMRRFQPIHAELLTRLGPRPGERILDLASGPGEPARTLGSHVGPGGEVLGVDLSEKMVELARREAQRSTVRNVEYRTMDCTRLDLADGTFDGATSAFGFQIFTDPEAAAREAHRVIKPGGRIAVCIWGAADRVPFLHALVGPMMAHAEPDETGYLPTPYETSGPGEMAGVLSAAGFRDAREDRARFSMAFRDPEEYFEVLLKGTPIGHSLLEEPPQVQEQVLREARASLERHRGPAGVTLDAECVFVVARR